MIVFVTSILDTKIAKANEMTKGIEGNPEKSLVYLRINVYLCPQVITKNKYYGKG